MSYFTLGIDELDEVFGSYLKPGYMVVLAGYPGSGKTTLASTICYANALRGSKCLYISFFEDRDKLFDNISRLGIDLYSVESKGFLRFVKLPIMYSTDELGNLLIKLVDEFKPNIIVIDSVNALLYPIAGEKRAILQNTVYELPKAINGLVVVTSEVPEGYDVVDLGSIAYVADVVLMLRYRIEKGLISRILEVRKFRGAHIPVYEIPFTILEGSGISTYIPPLLRGLGREGRKLDVCCSYLKKVLDHLHLGMHIYVSYPPHIRPITISTILAGIQVANGLRSLVISYRYPPDVLRAQVIRSLTLYGVDRDHAENVVSKYSIFESFNPFTYSVSELALRELKLIEQYEVDIVVFHDAEISGSAYSRGDYIRELYNQVNYLRHRGLMIIRLGGRISRWFHRFSSSLADVVLNYIPHRDGGRVGLEFHVWRRGTSSIHVLTQEDLDGCCREIASLIQGARI